jgi:hypothetical protein
MNHSPKPGNGETHPSAPWRHTTLLGTKWTVSFTYKPYYSQIPGEKHMLPVGLEPAKWASEPPWTSCPSTSIGQFFAPGVLLPPHGRHNTRCANSLLFWEWTKQATTASFPISARSFLLIRRHVTPVVETALLYKVAYTTSACLDWIRATTDCHVTQHCKIFIAYCVHSFEATVFIGNLSLCTTSGEKWYSVDVTRILKHLNVFL